MARVSSQSGVAAYAAAMKGTCFPITAAIAVMATSIPANAKQTEREPTRIVAAGAVWDIDLSAVPQSLQLRKGRVLLALPLYPSKLIRIDRDVRDKNTTGVKMSAGKQFFRQVLADGKEVFCSSKTLDWMKDGGSIFYGRKSGTFSCLIDRDGDGQLDGEYEVRTLTGSGIPFITHGKSSGYEDIEPVPFTVLDPKSFNHDMKLELIWWSGNAHDGKAKFAARVKDSDGEYAFVEGYYGSGTVPGNFEFAGIEIALSSPAAKTLDITFGKLPAKAVMTTNGLNLYIGPAK